MVTYFMGERVAALGPISTSPINVITLSTISKRRVAVLFGPKYKSSVIKTYITPLVTIINTSIIPIISTNTISYSLITMNIYFNRPRRRRETQQFNMAT